MNSDNIYVLESTIRNVFWELQNMKLLFDKAKSLF